MAADYDDSANTDAGLRNLAKRLQDILEKVMSLEPAKGGAMAGVSGQLRSLIEAAAAASAAPARQMQVIADAVKQQRAQIQLLQQQLQIFDDQLALLESTLKPAVEVGNQLTKAQEAMLGAFLPDS
jgi:hypothetical protein